MTGQRRVIRVSEPCIDEDDVKSVVEVLKSGWLAHGPVVEEFEKLVAELAGTRYAIAVSNGTVALKLILQWLRLAPGDEVIVPCFTFIATANAVLLAGGKPVFADIELETYNIDPARVQELVSRRTRAIVAVHLYGHPADMKALREIAEDYKLVLIEDAAQAHGARTPEGPVGGLGDAAAFSFYATKNATTGEGGAITTNIEELAYFARMVRNHGQERKYLHVMLGENYRLTSIQAALGITQPRKLPRLNEARRRNARVLNDLLKNTGLVLPRERPGYYHVYHQYVVRVDPGKTGLTRDELAAKLREKGIETAVHYPLPIPDQPLYKSLGYPPSKLICPNALEASKQVLSLPVHPRLSTEDLHYIAYAVKEALGQA